VSSYAGHQWHGTNSQLCHCGISNSIATGKIMAIGGCHAWQQDIELWSYVIDLKRLNRSHSKKHQQLLGNRHGGSGFPRKYTVWNFGYAAHDIF